MNQRNPLTSTNPTRWLVLPLISLSLLGPAYAESTPTQLAGPPARDGASIAAEDANGLSAALPFLITSPGQRRLAAELLESIERGNLKDAESSLDAAIETGTLAIALANRLNDPTLLSSLRNLDLHDVRRQSASSAECDGPATTANANLAQLQEALDHEQAYSGMIARTLTDLTEQYNVLTARLETEASDSVLEISELRKALQQEQQQHEAAARELADLQADYRALQATEESGSTPNPPDIANLEALLQHERQRSADAERQFASAREEMRTELASRDNEFKDREAAAAARIAELEDALSQARARGDDLARKLAGAGEALHSLQKASMQTPPTSESASMQAETLTILLQKDVPVPDNVGSVLPVKEGTLEVAQLPEKALPPSASIAPAALPTPTGPAPAPPTKAGPPPPALKPDDRLTTRAEELLQKGDVSGARLLLERSVKSGNARAAFLLAETFDPHVLARLGVLGIRGDAGKAREFYAQALALGMTEASGRLEALK